MKTISTQRVAPSCCGLVNLPPVYAQTAFMCTRDKSMAFSDQDKKKEESAYLDDLRAMFQGHIKTTEGQAGASFG